MGHLSSYSKAELSLQGGCGKVIGGITTAKCGDRQPDMEAWLCDECHDKWQAAIRKLHKANEEKP